MGASYGTLVSTVVESWTNPDVVPKTTDKPKHDPTFGFSNERTPRGFSYTFFSIHLFRRGLALFLFVKFY